MVGDGDDIAGRLLVDVAVGERAEAGSDGLGLRGSNRRCHLGGVRPEELHSASVALEWERTAAFGLRPRQDSNLRTRLRRPMLYPLSYEGMPLGRDEASPYPRSSL